MTDILPGADPRSFHVATQDHDQDPLIESMLDFIKEVTS